MAVAETESVPKDLIRMGRAAEILQCHPETVKRHAKTGKIRGWRRGGVGEWLVSEAEVRQLLVPVAPRRPGPRMESRAEADARHERACAELRKIGFEV